MIEIDDLCVGYGSQPFLRHLSLQVPQGQFLGILGPNGSGKTTLIRALSGTLRPHSGQIRIAGQNIQQLSAKTRARACATITQKTPRIDGIGVLALVLMGRYPYLGWLGSYGRQDQDQAHEALKWTQALTLAQRSCQTLSGGELQRVILAKALAQDTNLLLLDEAASNLDLARTMDMYNLLQAKNKAGLTIVTVAHDVNLAALYCQRLIFLKNGSIVADGPTREIITAQLLSEIYETPVVVSAHPVTGVPQAHLVPDA
ncbi:MAG: ABC transporter ATP-binding protein [Desulfomicrobium sp.]|nr:ABC transporter ATP-binding protein [Desulfomicrobium sp.]